MSTAPNVVIFLADDLGYSDLGCYGSEIRTPHLDQLGMGGVRLRNFHNTPRCSPSRASLLTGLHPHQTGMGILADDSSAEGGYRGKLNDRCVTIAEALRAAGYATAVRGKWHLTDSRREPDDAWPTKRGFDSFYGTLTGCGSYYQPGTLTRDVTNVEDEALEPDFFYTDAIAKESVEFLQTHFESNGTDKPFFLYVPFTAPHWPLHARQETIQSYEGVYNEGWDVIRERRFERQKQMGVIPQDTVLSPKHPSVPDWQDEPYRDWQVRRMQTYAAMVTELDSAVGVVLEQLRNLGVIENTLIIFMSDNGASDESLPFVEYERFRERTDILRHVTRGGEEVQLFNNPKIMPGPENTYASYGRGWANVSNTPYRLFKLYAHEGGVAAPFIAHWPEGGLAEGTVLANTFQLINVMPTILDIAGANYPKERNGVEVLPLESESMLPALRGGEQQNEVLWWEHCGNGALIRGNWKLVREYQWPWELYDLSVDRAETNDVSMDHPELVAELSEEWELRANRYGVIPFQKTMEIFRHRGLGHNYAIG